LTFAVPAAAYSIGVAGQSGSLTATEASVGRSVLSTSGALSAGAS
jgi:hypothetical protein